MRSRGRILFGCALVLMELAPAAAAAEANPAVGGQNAGDIREPADDAGPAAITAPAVIVDSPARPLGIGGDVDLALTFDAQGEVVDARVTHSSDPRLSASALDAVGGLRFSPALSAGQPVEVEIGFRYHFVAPPPPPPRAVIRGDVLSRGNRRPIAGVEVASGEALVGVSR